MKKAAKVGTLDTADQAPLCTPPLQPALADDLSSSLLSLGKLREIAAVGVSDWSLWNDGETGFVLTVYGQDGQPQSFYLKHPAVQGLYQALGQHFGPAEADGRTAATH